jgi:hypothetical protein
LKKLNKYSSTSWQAKAYPALVSPDRNAHEHEPEVFTFFDDATSRSRGVRYKNREILGRNEKKEFFNHGVMAEGDLAHAYPNLYRELIKKGVFPEPDPRFYRAGLELQTRTRADLRRQGKDE